jgi:hypothetical protein
VSGGSGLVRMNADGNDQQALVEASTGELSVDDRSGDFVASDGTINKVSPPTNALLWRA